MCMAKRDQVSRGVIGDLVVVAQHLRAWIAYSGGDHTLGYWRTKSGTEVDFVVYGDRTFVAIEVKHARTVRAKDLTSLRAFLEDYLLPRLERFAINPGKPVFVMMGNDDLPIGACMIPALSTRNSTREAVLISLTIRAIS